jgi:hypothetical protein
MNLATNTTPDSIGILLSRCGLPKDIIGEIRCFLTPCWFCRKGKITVHLLNDVTFWHSNPLRERIAFRSSREITAFAFLSKSSNVTIIHRDKRYVCRDCRDNIVNYVKYVNYRCQPLYKNLDHWIITFTLLDKRLHEGFMAALRQHHPNKLQLYIARYKWYIGGSRSQVKKRKYWPV